MRKNDPLGKAIEDYENGIKDGEITVLSDLAEDDVIPVDYLFRKNLPEIEQTAIKHASGKVLDIGAGSGVHYLPLMEQKAVTAYEAIDISPKAVKHLQGKGLTAYEADFFELKDKKYDTLLLLMNGIGIVGVLERLPEFFKQAKNLLHENGKIICDSTHIDYFFTDEDGGIWVDLNAKYKGEFKFKMQYKNHSTDWFNWLYIDFQLLKEEAKKHGFSCELLFEDEEESVYLAEMVLS